MKLSSTLVATLLVYSHLLLLNGCSSSAPTSDLTKENIIPKPVSVIATEKSFELNSDVVIYVQEGAEDLVSVANQLTARLKLATGFTNTIEVVTSRPTSGIYLALGNLNEVVAMGAYELTISEDLITISAGQIVGLFNGVQTLLQLVPFSVTESEVYSIATGTIKDFPLYSWRGAMLDVARHFFSVEDVKRYIDLISMYKINVLHLHLSDDQGWRIEIKSWPNLAIHGGSIEVGGGQSGYYTQEQYKDIVAYAASRFITIVPEIDMPGHTNAALASYGELNSGTIVPKEGVVITDNPILDGKVKPTSLYKGIEVGWSTLRVEKEATFRFVNDVLRELAEMTPGGYLHIGGDEAEVTKKEDYIVFINRFKEIVNSLDKQMIGWEEIGQANLNEKDIAQLWRTAGYAEMAANKGAKIIMSPSKKVYLDMKYDSTTTLGQDWAAYIEIDASYNWDPATYVAGVENILGVEAPLWSETITNMDELEYMAFPRLIAIAEVAWTPASSRSWDEFKLRLGKHGPRLKALGVDYYASPLVPWK